MKFLFLTCTLCALFLGVLASAVPNPDALANPEALPNPEALANPDALANPEADPEADPDADPEALPAVIEGGIMARQAGDDASGPVDVSEGDDGDAPEKRDPKPKPPHPKYCWKGWNKKKFKGKWIHLCCKSKCCYFYHPLANKNLRSAKATLSPKGYVKLYKNSFCKGSPLKVGFGGYWSLSGGYYSMSL